MLVLGGPNHALGGAGAGEPNVGAGLLHGNDPRVDGAVVVVLALVAEGAGLGPALDDEVVGFLEAGAVLGGIDAALQRFDRGATDESGDDPAAGVAVEHGDLFGHADGVVNGDYVAEDGDLDVLGELGDDGGVEVDGGLHAPVRGVMLVAHNAVEAYFVGQGVLLVVLVVEDAGLVGIEIGIGESQASGVVLLQVLVANVSVGLLGEPVNFGLILGSR